MKQNHFLSALFPFLYLVLLVPMLAFPLSPDLSCFVMGGRSILEGANLYVDYIDLKSPIVYYFFAGVVGIFGDTPFNIRLFDLIWQFSTAVSIYYFAKKFFNINIARMAALLYCWTYTMMAWPNLFECESTIALPLIWSIGLFASERTTWKRYIIPGILISFIIAFKYTLGVIVFPFMYAILSDRDKTTWERIRELIFFSGTLVLGFVAFHFPLLDKSIRSGYMELVGFLGCYSSFPKSDWYDLPLIIKIIITTNGRPVSIGIGFLFFIGAFVSIRKNRGKQVHELIVLLISIYVLNLLGIIFEKKAFQYHFLRNSVPLAIIASFGINYSIEQFRQWRNNRKVILTLFCGISVALAIIGPFVPVSRNFVILYSYMADKSEYYKVLPGKNLLELDWVPYLKIKEVIDSTTGPHSKVINLSITELPLVLYGRYERVSSFAHSYIYEGGCYNASYLAKAAEDYRKADWIVARDNDDLTFFTGKQLSSYGSIKANPDLAAVLDSCFVIYTEIGGCKLLVSRESLHRLH